MMNSDNGVALVSVLLVLAFCSVVGAAYMSTVAVDVRIAENYSSAIRLRYLAEGGLEEARERLRASGELPSQALARAAGPDLGLESSTDLDLLVLSDDQPIVVSVPSTPATPSLHVFLRNDAVDGPEIVTDSNGIVTLVSIARIGDRRYRAEADVMRQPPAVAAALTLAGPPGTIGLANVAPAFRIDGLDRCGMGAVHAVGLISDPATTSVRVEIPPSGVSSYPGVSGVPDAANVSGELPGAWRTVSALETLVRRLGEVATDRYMAAPVVPTAIGTIGAPDDPRIVWVEGDAVLHPGVGHGILIVRGSARIEDGFVWNGLILAVGAGRVDWNQVATVNGGLIVARTLDPPAANATIWTTRDDLGDLQIDFTGAGGGIYYDSCALDDAFRFLPLPPIAIRGY